MLEFTPILFTVDRHDKIDRRTVTIQGRPNKGKTIWATPVGAKLLKKGFITMVLP
jgi:hypothetical protein